MSQDASFAPGAEKADERPLLFAGFWRRMGAGFVDTLILLVPVFAIYYVLEPDFRLRMQYELNYEPPLLVTILIVLLCWFYKAAMESSYHRATLGKKALGLQVIDVNGYALSFGTASLRAWPFYASGVGMVLDRMLGTGVLELLIVLFAIVSCLAIAFTERKQGIHDMMAKSYVVRREPLAGPSVRIRS